MYLSWLVPIFYDKIICRKWSQRKQNQPKLLKTLPVGSLTSFIGTYNQKIRLSKMCKNCSPWTKFDPLTTSVFWIYNFSSLDKTKFVPFQNLNTNLMLVTPTQKQKVTWLSQQFQVPKKKIEKFGKIWVVDAGYLWFN